MGDGGAFFIWWEALPAGFRSFFSLFRTPLVFLKRRGVKEKDLGDGKRMENCNHVILV